MASVTVQQNEKRMEHTLSYTLCDSTSAVSRVSSPHNTSQKITQTLLTL